MKRIKRQTAVKGRFSAMLISAAVHVALLIAAGAFVAVTVVQRQEARFEGQQVSRPRMQLQRLQVPQRARQERQAPQMSQRVTAQAVSTRSVEFQMPEIAGLGGGIRVDMSGAGFAGGLGFATPQINLFGLRSQGEKVVFLLDTSEAMMTDEIGGIPAYEIIKDELIRMIRRLPPTTLFNLIVFARGGTLPQAFTEGLVPATSEKIEEVERWIAPLNTERDKIGFETLAWEGVEVDFHPLPPIANIQASWIAGLSYAIRSGADVVYWLGTNDQLRWIHRDLYEGAKRGRPVDPPSGQREDANEYVFATYPGGEQRWNQLVAQARALHEKENQERLARGQPERVLSPGERILVNAYLPGTLMPKTRAEGDVYGYIAQDVIEYIESLLRQVGQQGRRGGPARLRSTPQFSFNVIHFVPVNDPTRRLDRLAEVPRRMNGQYVRIQGLEAIRSASSGGR